jgi:hypothetical protein
MSLMEGGEEQFQQMKESGSIARATQRIDAAVERLNMTPAAIVQLFIDLWNSFSINDLIHPIAAFQRIIATFGEPISRLIAFVVEIVKIVVVVILEIMNFPFDLINNIIRRTLAAFESIKRDPIGFLKNLLRAIKQGFIQFFDNIVTHLINGVVGWLMSELRDAGIPELTDFSLRGVIGWVLEVLGISMERIWEKLAAHPRIGPERVARLRSMINTLEGIWTFIRDVQERGVAAIWEKIQEQLTNLWNTVIDAVKNWVMERIVTQVTARLLSMLDPTGIMAVVNSCIAIYSAIQSFIKYMRQMLEVINSFVNGVADIAAGNITTAANYLENTMGRAMPIVIGFLANQVGLGGVGRRIGEMIERVREMVDRALTWLVNRAVDTGMNLLDRAMAMGRSAVSAVVGWLGIRKRFSTDNGQGHEIYFTGQTNSRQLIVASNNPQSIEQKIPARLIILRRNETRNRTKIAACEAALAVKTTMDRHIATHISSQPEGSSDTTAIQGQIDGYLEQIKGQLVIGGVDSDMDIPLTNVTYQMEAGKAKKITAQPLTKLSGNTRGQNVSGRNGPIGWEIANYLNSNRTSGETTSSGRASRIIDWRRVHLLSAVLHGPAENWNLTPTNQSLNSRMSVIENTVSQEITNNEIYEKYETEIVDYNPSSSATHPVLGNWNTDYFPKKVKVTKRKSGEASDSVAVEMDNLPAPDPVTLETRIDYFETKKGLIDDYIRTLSPHSEKMEFSVFARNRLNLSRDIPESVRPDIRRRLSDYYNTFE